MFERSKILAVIDGDLYPGIDGADDLPIAGYDANVGPADHAPYTACGGVVSYGLISQLHIRCQASRYRYPQDTALHEPRPFSGVVDWMFERDLVFAI